MRRIALLLACSLLAPSVAAAEWSADAALARATELEATLAELRLLGSAAPQQETTFQQRTRDAAAAMMTDVHAMSQELVERLQSGQGRGETELLIAQLRGAFRESMRRAREAVPQPGVAELLDRAGVSLKELQRLYDAP